MTNIVEKIKSLVDEENPPIVPAIALIVLGLSLILTAFVSVALWLFIAVGTLVEGHYVLALSLLIGPGAVAALFIGAMYGDDAVEPRAEGEDE